MDDAIRVGGHWWPMIQMEWIEGWTLDSYVGHLVARRDVGALHVLAGSRRDQVRRLQSAEFGHGDLQHGNVLVDTSRALRLVDFDGSWIAAFDGWTPPHETGNVNYQRTGRIWGRWMDTFPALVIYTAFLAGSRNPDAWHRLYDENNMLFSRDDFARPGRTPAWELLAEIDDPEVEHAANRLRACCGPSWSGEETLERLLSVPPITPPPVPAEPPLFVLSDAPPQDWYRGAAIPPPSPVPDPYTPGDKPMFAGVSGSGGGPVPGTPPTGPGAPPLPPPPPQYPPPPVPRPPDPPARKSSTGTAIAVAATIAVVLGTLVGVGAGAGGGDSGPAALITAVLAFVTVLVVVLRAPGR